MRQNLAEFFQEKKVIVCVGSGGVGKTTLSASLGVLAAQKGLKVLVLTIDPSLRLKEALGLKTLTSQAVRVPGQNYRGQLDAALLVSDEIFERFIRSSSTNKDLAERLVKNRLYRLLSTTLSGSQEFTALIHLLDATESQNYDLVILDTPPAQHAIDFLLAPTKLQALFQDKVVGWFLEPAENSGFLKKIISRGTKTALTILEKLTGSLFMSELNDFFTSVKSVQDKILLKIDSVEKLLRDKKTSFLLVSVFDEIKLREALALKDFLQTENLSLGAVILNRYLPEIFEADLSINSDSYAAAEELRHFTQLVMKYNLYNKSKIEVLNRFLKNWQIDIPVFKISDFNVDMVGIQSLEKVANEVSTSRTL